MPLMDAKATLLKFGAGVLGMRWVKGQITIISKDVKWNYWCFYTKVKALDLGRASFWNFL
jgi:hypothetical protein